MSDELIRDLQEIASISALLIEGTDRKNLVDPEPRLVELLTRRGFLTEDKSTGFVGKARVIDHKK